MKEISESKESIALKILKLLETKKNVSLWLLLTPHFIKVFSWERRFNETTTRTRFCWQHRQYWYLRMSNRFLGITQPLEYSAEQFFWTHMGIECLREENLDEFIGRKNLQLDPLNSSHDCKMTLLVALLMENG